MQDSVIYTKFLKLFLYTDVYNKPCCVFCTDVYYLLPIIIAPLTLDEDHVMQATNTIKR